MLVYNILIPVFFSSPHTPPQHHNRTRSPYLARFIHVYYTSDQEGHFGSLGSAFLLSLGRLVTTTHKKLLHKVPLSTCQSRLNLQVQALKHAQGIPNTPHVSWKAHTSMSLTATRSLSSLDNILPICFLIQICMVILLFSQPLAQSTFRVVQSIPLTKFAVQSRSQNLRRPTPGAIGTQKLG